jgi:hypothetical protein
MAIKAMWISSATAQVGGHRPRRGSDIIGEAIIRKSQRLLTLALVHLDTRYREDVLMRDEGVRWARGRVGRRWLSPLVTGAEAAVAR